MHATDNHPSTPSLISFTAHSPNLVSLQLHIPHQCTKQLQRLRGGANYALHNNQRLSYLISVISGCSGISNPPQTDVNPLSAGDLVGEMRLAIVGRFLFDFREVVA